jgi:hypothetical protein
MKSRTELGALDARLILLIIMGPPFGAAHLVFRHELIWSLIVFLAWLVACFPLMQWLNRKKLARKRYVLLMIVIMSGFFGVVFYASATA